MKNILITGGTSGIGLEISKQLSECKIFNASRVNGFDLTNYETPTKIVDIIKSKKIDTVFLNSGIRVGKNVGEYTDDEIDGIMNVNCIANIKIINKIFDLIKSKKIKVIVTLSTSSYINGALESVYSSSKTCLKDYVVSANTELKSLNNDNYIFMFVPHFIQGTAISGRKNAPNVEIKNIVSKLISKINGGDVSFTPKYNEIYKKVFDEFYNNPIQQGLSSIEYKSRRK